MVVAQPRRLAPFLRNPVLHVQRHEEKYSVSNIRSPSFGIDQSQCCIFAISASLCGKPAFECDVIYDGADPLASPDLLVLQGLPNLKLASLKPLINWDSTDEMNLFKLLEAMKAVYLERELARIHEAGLDAVAFDISSVSHYSNLEYRLFNDGVEKSVHAQFDVEFQKNAPSETKPVTDVLTEKQPASIKLVYSISSYDNSVTNVERSVEFSDDENVFVPKMASNVPLIDVVLELEESVKKHLASKDELTGKKKKLCMKMVDRFTTQLLEYDALSYDKASFYFELKPATVKKDAVGVIAMFEFFDAKPPRLSLISPIKSRTGADDDYMPDVRMIPIMLDMTVSSDQNVNDIHSVLRTQIPAFAASVPHISGAYQNSMRPSGPQASAKTSLWG
ncbi:hypothetical protein BDR26DRAFT_892043 [Obelidium mucronatum]|nr:hypothetical protein BDR26DRAFT_892043 [Obelidium mucronatum]